MRLWSIHPKYLDSKGLVALWREGLLAQKVLQKKTKGYKNHPQLIRFLQCKNPVNAISLYLTSVFLESGKRGYRFDKKKIKKSRETSMQIEVTNGQVQYEWKLLKNKIYNRDITKYNEIKKVGFPDVHPIFKIIDGEIMKWEKEKELNNN